MSRFGFVLLATVAVAQANAACEVNQPASALTPLQREKCRQAVIAALAPDTAFASVSADAYVKQTEFDNTPYRFNMTQNGRRMTADDFDAWLKANGYSVGRRVEPDGAQ